jgi:hypothetical protein
MNGVTPGWAMRITAPCRCPAGGGVLRAQAEATEKTTTSAAGDSLKVVIRVQVCA